MEENCLTSSSLSWARSHSTTPLKSLDSGVGCGAAEAHSIIGL